MPEKEKKQGQSDVSPRNSDWGIKEIKLAGGTH
jgi:hypothetical protein